MHYRSIALAVSLLTIGAAQSKASITMTLVGGNYTLPNSATVVAEGTLFQLIDLGANGVFDQINLLDGNTSATGQWVSGDDVLITATYIGSTDYATLGGFDLIPGNTPDFPGFIDRSFQANIVQGTKLGIRWFPGLTAANYYLPGSITLASGQAYGQFTRQTDRASDIGGVASLYDPNVASEYTGVKNGGVAWVAPANGATISLDPFATATYGGADSATVGQANLTVLPPVPEPGTVGLALLGTAGLFGLRRRRS
jgi:hypothetical protein